MLRPLLPRREFGKNSRGVSSIIATIFMVIIILFISFNVFTFTLFKNTQFRDAVDQLNQMDVEQTYERISFTDVSFTPLENYVLVEAQLKNDGPVSVKIVTLWVVHTSTEKYGYADKLNIDLAAGKIRSFQKWVEMEGLNFSGGFAAWFITARGNRIPLEDKVVYAELSQGFGSLVLDFNNFRYYLYQKINSTLLNYPEGNVSFNIPQGAYVGFGIYLRNEDPKKRTIILDSHSFFWQPGREGLGEYSWFIVNVNPSSGTVDEEDYSEVTIKYGEGKMLVFLSSNDLEKGFDVAKTPTKRVTVATFIVLHGEIGPDSFAQNIPFVSLFYEFYS